MNPNPNRSRQHGFTLIELAVVLVIVGLLAGGGIALFRAFNEQAMRSETGEYLEKVRQSLLVYANINGKLPAPDTSVPSYKKILYIYANLGVGPNDTWGRPLKYEVNSNLLVNKSTSCSYLKNTLDKTYTGAAKITAPEVWDQDANGQFAVAVVLVSGGAADADNSGTGEAAIFDGIGGKGSNYTGTPFLRDRPQADFDDLVSYIGAATLYDWMKCN